MRLFPRALPTMAQPTEVDDFIAHHPHFLVITSFNAKEWLPVYLMNRQETKGDISVRLALLDPTFYWRGGSILDVEVK